MSSCSIPKRRAWDMTSITCAIRFELGRRRMVDSRKRRPWHSISSVPNAPTQRPSERANLKMDFGHG